VKKVNECIICGENFFNNYDAAIAPFLAERIWNKKPFNIKLVLCKNCGFTFYNPRLEENEVNTYYENYRSDSYQEQRYKYEPFFTKELNEQIGGDVEKISRKENLFKLLSKYVDISSIKNVLDYGGDKGQFIIDQLAHTNRYVFDISKIDPLDDIIKINSYEECKNHQYDLITCAHVLEHVSYPIEIIKSIKDLADKNTVVYLEIPLENPFYYNNVLMNLLGKMPFIGPLMFNIKEIFKKRNVLSINKHTNSFSKNSLKTLVTSMPLYLKRIMAFRKFFMHEHVNYFTPQSLENMLISNGFKDIRIEVVTLNCGWANVQLICCLARIK
jgi:hypothetical protein